MIKIAICDDENDELIKTKSLICSYLETHLNIAGVVSTFLSSNMLLSEIKKSQTYDLYILDIIMPQINGIELGKRIREEDNSGCIIYLTTSTDYAVESYDAHAFYYLVKPVEETRLFDILDKALLQINTEKQKNITVHIPEGIIRIPFDDILYVEQVKRTLEYHLVDGTKEVSCMLREPFTVAVQSLLNDKRFFLCGSSFLLNMQRIKIIRGTEAIFSTGFSVSIPRTKQKETKGKWIEYWLTEERKNEI